jgi:hypothetical protein
MNAKKLKGNPKKLKKLSTEDLMELFHMTNAEIKLLSEKVEQEDLEDFSNNEINSLENFLEQIEDILDTRE